MAIKSLLFCLFLYVCLAWVGAAYLYQGPDIIHYGLLWTALGLIAVLAFIIGARLYGWWRLGRAKAASRPAPPPKSIPSAHPEDEAVAALIAEANAALCKAPAFAGVRTKTPLSTLPLYLLIGPEGSGKTSTFLNSGIEPQLLAGQGTTPVAPTRLCNIWLAKNAIFAEISGRAFAGDLSRWSQTLAAFRGRVAVPKWRQIWGESESQTDLRGVIAFCDSKEFTGAASDPQRLERFSRDWQERLRAIAEQFGNDFPVYVAITKSDKITYFTDFFRRLPELENNQVLGCTLAPNRTQTRSTNEVFVEAEAKRLTESFRPLYHALTRRRLAQLAHEPNPSSRPGIYEFPRELKRLRSPLVQFLTEVFRPNSLGPAAVLRGYYFTGVREAEVDLTDPAARTGDSHHPFEATRLFRGEVTQLFQGDDLTKAPRPEGRKALGMRWAFVADLFHKIVLADRTAPRRVPPSAPFAGRYRRVAFAAVCGLCFLLSVAFVVSWINNRRLLSDVAHAANSQPDRQGRATTLADLQALESLRLQLVRLQEHQPLSFHWGLYSGDQVLPQTRTRYFRQFSKLLLIDMNAQMVAALNELPNHPDANAPSDLVYRTLKGHLMITSGPCGVEPPFVSKLLKDVRAQTAPAISTDGQVLADRQIDFYANELALGNPLRIPEDADGLTRARQYLRQAQGIDRLYAGILAAAQAKVGKANRLSDLASNYPQVLSGPDEVSAAFSRDGWAFIEKASRENNTAALGEPCVLGEASGLASGWKQNTATAQAVQRLYFRDYIEHWRKFVEGFSVLRYSSAADAARKLDILADHKSPLLAVLAITANHTNFPLPSEASDANVVQKTANKLLAPFKKAESEAKAVIAPQDPSDGMSTPADVTRYFQPVHSVEPPGSETWVVDKNAAYIDALAQLRHSMQDIAQATTPDPAVYQTASQNYEKALDVVRQISKSFRPSGVGGLDGTVERLLEQPIQLTNVLIPRDITLLPGKKANADLQRFCLSQKSTLRKYPLQPSASDDANLDEFTAFFDPMKGGIWRFEQQALGDFVQKDGAQWKSKDPSKKPQVTGELLAFLNRAQSVTDVFYGSGPQPQLSYTFRPKLDSRLKEFTLELDVDGRPFQWTNPLQHQFSWPAAPGTKDPGAVARLRSSSNVALAFASRGGIWGIFRILNDAEPRDLGAKLVEWRYTSGGVGRREAITPAPVQLEIVGFPGGQDVFNPKFWDGLRCPSAAVQ